MRKLFAVVGLSLLLTACGSQTVRFSLAFDTEDTVRKSELTAAIARTVEGRLEAKKKSAKSQGIKEENGSTILTVEASDAEGATVLQEGLTAPFTMSIMKQVEEGQGDIVSETYGEFKETGIKTEHFDWVTPGTKTDANGQLKGAVVIAFTPKGQELLKTIFAANRGGAIGIFVRGQLMSMKMIDFTDKQTSIAIDGIPSGELAAAFADDVNVGLHVTFTVLP